MAALPLRATPFFELDEEFFISDELVGRLYRSSEQAILEIAARRLPPSTPKAPSGLQLTKAQ